MATLHGIIADPTRFTEMILRIHGASENGKVFLSTRGFTLSTLLEQGGEFHTSVIARITFPINMFEVYVFEGIGRKYSFFDFNALLQEAEHISVAESPVDLRIDCADPTPRFIIRYTTDGYENVASIPMINRPVPNFISFPRGVGLRILYQINEELEELMNECIYNQERVRIVVTQHVLAFIPQDRPYDQIVFLMDHETRMSNRGLILGSEIDLRCVNLGVVWEAAAASVRTEIRVPPVNPPRPLVFRCYSDFSFIDFVLPSPSLANVIMHHEADVPLEF